MYHTQPPQYNLPPNLQISPLPAKLAKRYLGYEAHERVQKHRELNEFRRRGRVSQDSLNHKLERERLQEVIRSTLIPALRLSSTARVAELDRTIKDLDEGNH